MSARAACRLVDLGFTQVYDYVPGKAAWLGMGLPSEGSLDPAERVGAVAARSLPEVGVGDLVRDVGLGSHEFAVVLDGEVVAGVVTRDALAGEAGRRVGDVLDPGPDTFRPSMTVAELRRYWEGNDERLALVTTLHGEYLGAILRDEMAARPA